MTDICGFSKPFIQSINLFSLASRQNGNSTSFLNSVHSHTTLGVTCCAGSVRTPFIWGIYLSVGAFEYSGREGQSLDIYSGPLTAA